MNTKKNILNLTLAAMFMAIGIVLPFFTGQIPQIGKMLLPMHIPVILCGLICGWQYGLVVGFILPFLRYVMFGMPLLFPTGIAMAFELIHVHAGSVLFHCTAAWLVQWLQGVLYGLLSRCFYLELVMVDLHYRCLWQGLF